jgi:hypothetical protein
MHSTLFLNLIGSIRNVSMASSEIREFIFTNNYNKYLGCKEISNRNLDENLSRLSIPHNIIINQCNLLSNYEIENLHYKIKTTNKSYKSLALLIAYNKYDKDKYINFIGNSPYIHYIYHLDFSERYKYNLLDNIIFKNK